MKKLLLPLILLLLGVGGGVGAGIFLAPPAVEEEMALGPCGEMPPVAEVMAEAESHDAEGEDHAAATGEHGEGDAAAEPIDAGAATGFEYVKMSNQFVVPVVQDGAVRSLVVLTVSVEVDFGMQDAVFAYEPKLRDVFLQVLFDHANGGGFDGQFTSAENMRNLRRALRLAAQEAVGEQVHDVLITDIVRQDT
jgi:flagellar protein FliL